MRCELQNLLEKIWGEYRILYTIAEDEVEIFRIGKRNDDEVYETL